MSRLFVAFWQLRQHAVAEEVVRGGSRRRRTGESWVLAAPLAERLRPLLTSGGLDPARPVAVEEPADRDGFWLSQPPA
jgi:hypothetical protein